MPLDSAGMPQQELEAVVLWYGVRSIWSIGLHLVSERKPCFFVKSFFRVTDE